MDYEFDRGIAVEPTGPGEYAAHLDAGWVVGGGVNGGYALAVIGNAIRAELSADGQPDPVSVSAYYLSPTAPGPAVVRVRRIRKGGQRSTVAASLVQQHEGQEVERITALAVYGDLDRMPAEVQRQIAPPELPPLEDCLDARQAPEEVRRMAPLLERFGTRIDPAYVGWAVGKPSGSGIIQGWFKLADDRPLDPIALLMVVDALPPVTFDLGLPGLGTDPRADRPRPCPSCSRLGDRRGTRPAPSPVASSRRTARSGTPRAGSSRMSRQLALLPRPPA